MADAQTVVIGVDVREYLKADRTYYVRTDGNDSNTGLVNNAGGAFLTIQKAANVAYGALDLAGFTVTIQVGDGTYTISTQIISPQTGAGVIIIQGNTANHSAVLVSTPDYGFVFGYAAVVTLKWMKIIAPNECIISAAYASVSCYGMVFGASFIQCYTNAGGSIFMDSDYDIVGGGGCHCDSTENGLFFLNNNITVTITGTPNFSLAFIYTQLNALVAGVGVTFSGGTTGTRYVCQELSIINTNGGGANYFPGNSAGTGGTTTGGGVYV